jgi:hypothetical protein
MQINTKHNLGYGYSNLAALRHKIPINYNKLLQDQPAISR